MAFLVNRGLKIERDAYRAVIRTHDLDVDFRFLHLLFQRFGYEHVVDSPSHVARARVCEMTPPRVVAVALRENAEGIYETGVDEILETLTFLVRETLLAAIRFRVCQIEFGVRDVEIAAEDHRLFLF